MAKRYIGDLEIEIKFNSQKNWYQGTVIGSQYRWHFNDLHLSPSDWMRLPVDSDEAFDLVASAAVSFGTYYTTGNRDYVQTIYPSAAGADMLEAESQFAIDEQGNYQVRRQP